MKQRLPEIKSLLLLALPLMLSQFCNLGKETIDTMMVGNIDKYNLAGMALAMSIFYLFSWFIIVFNGAFIAVFTRLRGADEFTILKEHIDQVFYLNIIVGSVCSLLLLNSSFIFQFLEVENQTKEIAQNYLSILGGFFLLISVMNVLRISLLSFVKNNIVFLTAIITFILNIPLNYLFIYKLNLGAEGSAWATVICHVIEFIVLFYFMAKIKEINILEKISKINLKEIYILFKIAFPAGLETLLFVVSLSAISFVLAKFGEIAVGTHQVLFSYFSLHVAFVSGFGTVMIQKGGFLLGEKNIDGIKDLIFNNFILILVVSIIQIILTIVFRNEIAWLYTKDPEIHNMVVAILLIAPFFHIVDNFRVLTKPPLRIYKKNKESLYISAPIYWFVVFLGGSFLAQHYSVLGFWIALGVGYLLINVLQGILIYRIIWLGEKNEKLS